MKNHTPSPIKITRIFSLFLLLQLSSFQSVAGENGFLDALSRVDLTAAGSAPAVPDSTKVIASLEKQNAALQQASDTAQKKQAQKIRALNAQVTTLKKQNAELLKSQQNTSHKEIAPNTNSADARLKEKLKGQPYQQIPGGLYLVVNKKGGAFYKDGETVRADIFEKKLDGTPILNTLNTALFMANADDSFINDVVKNGGKRGQVTVYGSASSIYSTLPERIKDDELIAITFVLK